MSIQTYRDLEVWQRAMELTVQIYKITECFPDDERYGLTSQIQRSAVSIPSNIAEGHGRVYRKDYVRHLSIARGSLAEVETQLAIAVRLEFVNRNQALPLWAMAQDVGKMLNRLIQSLAKED